MTGKKMMVLLVTVVAIMSIALTAWAAVYRYGGGTTTLIYDPAGDYACPSGTNVKFLYQVDGNTIHDSYGFVKFNGTFRRFAGGSTVYAEYRSPLAIDFDSSYRTWQTPYPRMTIGRADPESLSASAPMVMAIYCQ